MLRNLGRMPLRGHLISVASPHLCLLIIWKVSTLSLSKNLIPKMKATPSGPYQMLGPRPGHGCGVDRSSPTSSLTQRYPKVSLSPEVPQATTRLSSQSLLSVCIGIQPSEEPRMGKDPLSWLPALGYTQRGKW